jgi:hypothetical protein
MRRKRLAVKILVYSSLIIGLAGIAFCVWFSYCQRGSYETAAGAQYKKEQTPNPSPVIQQLEASQAGGKGNEYQPKTQWCDPTVIVNALLFLMITATAAIYWGQLRATRKLVEQNSDIVQAMQEQVTETRKSVRSAEKSAAAAEAGVEIARQKVISDQRAYISEVSLKQSNDSDNAILTYENTGKLTADEVITYVDMILLVPQALVEKQPDSLRESYMFCWWFNRGRIPLNDHVEVPLGECLNPMEKEKLHGAHVRLIAQIRIKYKDGFDNPDSCERAFRYHLGNWLPWPMWTSEDVQSRIAEERSRYQPK